MEVVRVGVSSLDERREWLERRRVVSGAVNACTVCDAVNVVEVDLVAHHGAVVLVHRSCMVCESSWVDRYHLAACSIESLEDIEGVAAETGACDLCGGVYALGADDHNGETGCHFECEAAAAAGAVWTIEAVQS